MNYKTIKKSLLFFIAMIVLFFILKTLLYTSLESIVIGTAKEAVLDVKSLTINEKLIELGGEVEVYPNQLFFHSDFENKLPQIAKTLQWGELPVVWKADEAVHFGTQRLIIKGLIPNREYGIQTLEALSAFSIYADGVLIASNGIVGPTAAESKPESRPTIGLFRSHSDQVEIIFQVSNYEGHITGLWQKIKISTAKNIIQYQERLGYVDALLFGSIFIMMIYHGILFMILRKDQAILYFTLFCLLIVIKIAYSGQQLGFRWYPWLDYNWGLRLAYLTIPLMAPAFLGFIYKCFPEEGNLKYIRVSLVATLLQCGVIIVAPQPFYQATFVGYQIVIVISCFVIAHWLIRAIINKRQGALIYFIGFIALFVTAVNDILYSLLIVQSGYFLGIGLFIALLSQATIIAMRFQQALTMEENIKINLENIVQQRTQQIENEKKLFEHLSKVDSLTHVFNKRYLAEALEVEFESYKRYQSVYSMIMIDLDGFKNINDTYGHLVGDEILTQFAAILKKNSRRTDIIGRFGGEEFLIIMRYIPIEEAAVLAEKLRLCIEENSFDTDAGKIQLTASFGVATVSLRDVSEQDSVKRADEGMYQSKINGRNQITICNPHEDMQSEQNKNIKKMGGNYDFGSNQS